MEQLKEFQKRAGVEFKNIDLLAQAFIHRSYLNEHPKLGMGHNERLEFLGDAVLELAVTEYLYRQYDNPEGDLTNWRSALVKTESLAEVAIQLGLDSLLKLSRGEAKSNGRSRVLISANCVEAIIGAIYMDQGFEAARDFITRHIISRLSEILKTGSWVDPKSKFQVLAQDKQGVTPTYRVLAEEGPDHDKLFTMGVFLGDNLWGQGSGSSKQIAQQQAAEDALKKISSTK